MLDSIPDRNQNPEVLLSAAIPVDGELEVAWQGKVARERFSYAWLRDHCHSKESLHPETLQRQVDTFKIPVDIAPAKLEIADGGRSLHIVWKHEGTVSILPAVFLWDIVQNNGRETSPRRRLWDPPRVRDSRAPSAIATPAPAPASHRARRDRKNQD